jgi:3-deoxy-D-arabino-heptulosonate 7-phosphate (DAHP) synthase
MESKRKPYQLVSREWKQTDTIIQLKNTQIGQGSVSVIAGPCAVENEDQIFTICEFLSKQGVKVVRGGAYRV